MWKAAILKIQEGYCQPTVSPSFAVEVTACLEAGRLLLFYCLNYQGYNAYDQCAELKKLCICNHLHPLPSTGGKKERLPPLRMRGSNRLPFVTVPTVNIIIFNL